MGRLAWSGRAVVALLAYALAYRPWQLRWGATPDEVAAELPGDELVPHAVWEATRAVDIAARPEHVWPWLIQMGASPRAGWYSYDWADNGGTPSASELRPELQHLEVGDLLPMTAGSDEGFRVEAIDSPRSLTLASRDRDGVVTAAFVLRPAGTGRTRLVHRVRFRVRPTRRGLTFAAIMELSDFVMSRRTLLGIRARAERLARRTRGGPPPTDHAPQTPLEFDLSVPVRRPAAAVYALLADVQEAEPLPRTAGVRLSKTPSGPTHEGTRWHEQVRVMPGVWMRIESAATDTAPPHALGMDFSATWFAGRLDYEIRDSPDGSVLRQRETLRLRGPLAPFATQVDARLRPRLLDRLADVRDAIEARPT
jgi:hypothetical protein